MLLLIGALIFFNWFASYCNHGVKNICAFPRICLNDILHFIIPIWVEWVTCKMMYCFVYKCDLTIYMKYHDLIVDICLKGKSHSLLQYNSLGRSGNTTNWYILLGMDVKYYTINKKHYNLRMELYLNRKSRPLRPLQLFRL